MLQYSEFNGGIAYFGAWLEVEQTDSLELKVTTILLVAMIQLLELSLRCYCFYQSLVSRAPSASHSFEVWASLYQRLLLSSMFYSCSFSTLSRSL
jgi:putative copper export protein